MEKQFISVHYYHFISRKSHYYWTFYGIRDIPEHETCPLCSHAIRSVMTKTLKRTQMFDLDPEEFFSYCCDEGESLPKIIVASGEAVIPLHPKGWSLVECDGDVAWDFEMQVRLLKKCATPESPNIVIRSKGRNTLKEFGTRKAMDKHREDDILNERWDDYWYEKDKNGDYRCSGFSMKEDIDSCSEYRITHPQECSDCRKWMRTLA